jgi:hypothetical protein
MKLQFFDFQHPPDPLQRGNHLRDYAFVPLRRCAFVPLCLCAISPLKLVHFLLYHKKHNYEEADDFLPVDFLRCSTYVADG